MSDFEAEGSLAWCVEDFVFFDVGGSGGDGGGVTVLGQVFTNSSF